MGDTDSDNGGSYSSSLEDDSGSETEYWGEYDCADDESASHYVWEDDELEIDDDFLIENIRKLLREFYSMDEQACIVEIRRIADDLNKPLIEMGNTDSSVSDSPNASGGCDDLPFADTDVEVMPKPIHDEVKVEVDQKLISSMNKRDCEYAIRQIKRRSYEIASSKKPPSKSKPNDGPQQLTSMPKAQNVYIRKHMKGEVVKSWIGLKYHKDSKRAVSYTLKSDERRGAFKKAIGLGGKKLEKKGLPYWVRRELNSHGNFRSQVQSVRLFSFTVFIHTLPGNDLNKALNRLTKITNWSHHSEFNVSYMTRKQGTPVIDGKLVDEMIALLNIFVDHAADAWEKAKGNIKSFVREDAEWTHTVEKPGNKTITDEAKRPE